ncbi:hypothetical protein GPEL0_01r0836 [Geoanaerobacter pelophilus]|uniref:Uncharacterized protein n=1 Tax=Geoanaerobacter pelophilus TaxID=60036 RepID=A0ABQ0MGB2_9BACT|nr:hypothetical protein GPEL0_01r0836 [Geoanaerobacter pelophilus]
MNPLVSAVPNAESSFFIVAAISTWSAAGVAAAKKSDLFPCDGQQLFFLQKKIQPSAIAATLPPARAPPPCPSPSRGGDEVDGAVPKLREGRNAPSPSGGGSGRGSSSGLVSLTPDPSE